VPAPQLGSSDPAAADAATELAATARVPSRLDSVPAARAFLTKLLQGWSVAEDVVDDAALLTTETMANALEHGDGLVSMTISLEHGVLHIAVADKADHRQPQVLTVNSTSDGGRGMWIVDIVAKDWGTDAMPGAAGGKTVWFELNAAGSEPWPPEPPAVEADLVPERSESIPFGLPSKVPERAAFSAHAGSRTELKGIPVIVYEDKLSALLGDFARTLLTDFPIQGILDHLVERIVDALPVTSVGVTLMSPGLGAHCVAGSNAPTLAFERLKTELQLSPSLSAYEAGEVVEIADIAADLRFPAFSRAAATAGISAAFAFPLWHNDGRLGVLDLYRDAPGPLDARDLMAAQTMADVTAAYIINSQAREVVRETTDRSRDTALRDPLTGLPNRLMLHQELRRAADRAEHAENNVAVLFADLDRFKQINDTYGHHVGDELLIAVAHRLSGLVRPGDILARVSGDEFVILCQGVTHAGAIELLAARIDEAFMLPFVLSGVDLFVTASVGMAYAGPGVAVTPQLVVNADIAMYQAKRKGGAGHQIIDLREATRSADRSSLEQDLHLAFSREELSVAYQPVVRASDGLITGAEALLRWMHPERGPVSRLDIVGVAEDNGLIHQIGAWVLERACTERRRWLGQGKRLDIAVNVSARQLMAPDFCAGVAAVIAKTKMDPTGLVLEMTEGIFIRDGERAMAVLGELKAMGIRLALDDFGTGYSSLSYLRRFPVDILKIDRSFVPEIETDLTVAAIAEAITRLAHVLGLSVVAEGVETAGQRNGIVAVGCDSAQGYFYAPPLPADAFSAMLASGPRGGESFLPVLPISLRPGA
jgi:diguanylate cyclase (GGDEF)-like protein